MAGIRYLPAGFTLVESCMVAVITPVLAGTLLVMSQTGLRVWAMTEARLNSLTEPQRALNRLAEDVRNADPNSWSICQAKTLEFTKADSATTIHYALNGTTLMRTEGLVSQVVASGLTEFVPTCQAGVVSIKLTTTVASPAVGGMPVTHMLQSKVWVRRAL